MENPFKSKKDPRVLIANAAVSVLLDRLGGTATVSDIELTALADRYGGAGGMKGGIVAEGVHRLALVATKARPAEGSISPCRRVPRRHAGATGCPHATTSVRGVRARAP